MILSQVWRAGMSFLENIPKLVQAYDFAEKKPDAEMS
jgi:hypothetical protein